MSSNRLLKSDISDLDIVDAYELGSDGYRLFLTTSVLSTVSITKIVTLASPFTLNTYDDPVESGDRFRLANSSGADGYYIINQILSTTSFSVNENISNSSGGDGYFMYDAGALKIGFNKSRYPSVFVTHTDVQNAIQDLDIAIQGANTGLTPIQHASLRQLIHLADSGSGGLFESQNVSYRTITPSGNPFPTNITWWETNAQLKKIVQKNITYNVNKVPSTISWTVYHTDGLTALATATDTINYTNNVFEINRVRNVVEFVPILGTLDVNSHKAVRQLIHLSDTQGPYETFTGAVRVISPLGSAFPTSIIWYKDNTLTGRIVDKFINYNPNKTVSQIIYKVYDVDNITVLATATDIVNYSGVFETNRSRTVI